MTPFSSLEVKKNHDETVATEKMDQANPKKI